MNASFVTPPARALTGVVLMLSLLLAWPASAELPSIEGSYQLVSRQLADGTLMQSPTIMGVITYTKTHRNSNILVVGAHGRRQSFSTVSAYTLTATEYSETLLFNIVNDEGGGQPVTYDLSTRTHRTPVKAEGARVEFKPPFDPPEFVFQGGDLTATFPDGTTDRWKKLP